jgi:hypothetical protein
MIDALSSNRDRYPLIAVGIIIGTLPLAMRPILMMGLCAGTLVGLSILRNPRHGLLLVAATIPLETAGQIGALTAHLPLTVPKLLTLATLLAWLIHLALGRMNFRHLPWMYYLPGFLAAAGASLIGAEETRSGLEAVLRFSNTIIFYFLIVQLLDTPVILKTCLILFLATSTLAASWSIVQRFVPGSSFAFRYGWEEQDARRSGVEQDIVEQHMVGIVERSSGLSPHSILLALNICLLLAPLAAFMTNTRPTNTFLQCTWLAMLAVLLAAIVVTYARTGFVIVLFCFSLMTWRGLFSLTTTKVIAIVATLLIFILTVPDKYIDRVLSTRAYTTQSSSVSIRIDLAKAAFAQFLDHPLLGVGYGNRYGIFDYFTSYRDKQHAVTPHNSFLQVAAQTGIIGLLILMTFFWKTHRALCKAAAIFAAKGQYDLARLGIALDISLLALLFSGLAIDLFDKGMAHAWLIIGTAGALALLAERPAKKESVLSMEPL